MISPGRVQGAGGSVRPSPAAPTNCSVATEPSSPTFPPAARVFAGIMEAAAKSAEISEAVNIRALNAHDGKQSRDSAKFHAGHGPYLRSR